MTAEFSSLIEQAQEQLNLIATLTFPGYTDEVKRAPKAALAALDSLASLVAEREAELERAHNGAMAERLRARVAEARIAELEQALDDACDVAIWLTGLPIPDEALPYWVKARERLFAAMEKRRSLSAGHAGEQE